jgi:hypothetical protein
LSSNPFRAKVPTCDAKKLRSDPPILPKGVLTPSIKTTSLSAIVSPKIYLFFINNGRLPTTITMLLAFSQFGFAIPDCFQARDTDYRCDFTITPSLVQKIL